MWGRCKWTSTFTAATVSKHRLSGESMGPRLSEVYPKLREALQEFGLEHGGLQEALDGLVSLLEEDLVSMEDLAVAYVQDRLIGWPHMFGLRGDWRTLVENLLCLLKPVEEELLPPRGPVNCRIWEIFARAKLQQRQWFVVASIVRNMSVRLNMDGPPQCPGLPEDHVMVMTIQKGFSHLLASFHAVQRHLERCQLISTELQTNMIIFRARLESCSRSIVGAITRQPWPGKYVPRPDENFDVRMTERWQWLSADACKIAEELGKLPSMSDAFEVISLSSWSRISETASDRGPAMLTAHLEQSVASNYSVDSDMSCLSGQGGPHCFLPSYLFKHPQAAGATAWVSAQDWGTVVKSGIESVMALARSC